MNRFHLSIVECHFGLHDGTRATQLSYAVDLKTDRGSFAANVQSDFSRLQRSCVLSVQRDDYSEGE